MINAKKCEVVAVRSMLKPNYLGIFICRCSESIGENNSGIIIRKGNISDCKELARLIQELADFQKMPDGPKINEKILEKDGFITDPPLYHLFVAELPQKPGQSASELVGYALYFNKYSTWKGKAMILEDLYCTPKYREQHIGSELFRAVVKEALSTGCQQMDFEVLEWNPARKFYERFGAVDITEKESWHIYRMSKDVLESVQPRA